MPRNRFLAGLMLLALVAVPARAEDDFELKQNQPGSSMTPYKESFPTEVEATARLWNQVKVSALNEQTNALRVEFDQYKRVRFERQTSLANQTGSTGIQYQPQPEHVPAVMVTGIRW